MGSLNERSFTGDRMVYEKCGEIENFNEQRLFNITRFSMLSKIEI